MRNATLLVAALLVSCGGDPSPDIRSPGRLPGPLERLELARESPEIPPIGYPHALHLDPEVVGRPLACTRCHHHLADVAGALPAKCSSCHPLEPEDGKPPDL